MENKSLPEWIKSKGFDDYQTGLNSRFSAHGMQYAYHYDERHTIKSVVVFLGMENIKTRIELIENGNLDFHYSQNNKEIQEEFESCSADDFHLMLAHSFIYLKKGNFDYHKKWHSSLKRRRTIEK